MLVLDQKQIKAHKIKKAEVRTVDVSVGEMSPETRGRYGRFIVSVKFVLLDRSGTPISTVTIENTSDNYSDINDLVKKSRLALRNHLLDLLVWLIRTDGGLVSSGGLTSRKPKSHEVFV